MRPPPLVVEGADGEPAGHEAELAELGGGALQVATGPLLPRQPDARQRPDLGVGVRVVEQAAEREDPAGAVRDLVGQLAQLGERDHGARPVVAIERGEGGGVALGGQVATARRDPPCRRGGGRAEQGGEREERSIHPARVPGPCTMT